MPSRTIKKALGLVTSPNSIDVPDGSLETADNCVISEQGKIERRRGIPTFNDDLDAGVETFTEWEDGTILAKDADGGLYRDGGAGSWTKYTGDYDKPSGALASRFTRPGSLFFTTDEGVYKLDSLTGTPYPAGLTQPVSPQVLGFGSTGWATVNATTAFRVVIGRRDARDRLILSAPSERRATFPNTLAFNYFRVYVTLPDDVREGDFIQVYRTLEQTVTGVDPGDEMFQAAEYFVTASDISAGIAEVDTFAPDVLLGNALYTNITQQGVAQANNTPPLVREATSWQGMSFYADSQQRHTVDIQLVDATEETGLSFMSISGTAASGSPVLSSITLVSTGNSATAVTTSDLRPGMRFSSTRFPNAVIVSIDSATQITVSENATSSGSTVATAQDHVTVDGVSFYAGNGLTATGFIATGDQTISENIEDTSQSLQAAMNISARAGTLQAWCDYVSGPDDPPGRLRIRRRSLSQTAFTVTSSNPAAFSPALSTTTNVVTSDNDRRKNRVYVSKLLQPEAVPVGQFLDVGEESQPCRLVPTQYSLFALKPDGAYVVQGTTPDTLQVRPLDLGFSLPEDRFNTVRVLNDQVYCWSSRGVCQISTRGVQIVSRAIDAELAESGQSTALGAAAHEADQRYLLAVDHPTDPDNRVFCLNALTGTWTRWRIPTGETIGAMHVGVGEQLYIGNTDGKTRRQLRSLSAPSTNYYDDSESVTISSASGTTVTLSGTPTASGTGWWLVQGSNIQEITGFSGADLTVASTAGFSAGAATLYLDIPVTVEYTPITLDKPGINKRYQEVSVFFEENEVDSMDISCMSDWSSGAWQTEAVTPIDNQERAFMRIYVPQEACIGNWLKVKVDFSQPLAQIALNGIALVYRAMTERFPA